MLSVSIILNKKMLHFYEQSWQNQIERILPKGLIQSKCKIFKLIQKNAAREKKKKLSSTIIISLG